MKEHIKLVRNNIPQYLAQYKDVKSTTRVLDMHEYEYELKKKLLEEVNKYLESEDIVELADVMEVICALAELKDANFEVIKTIMLNKRERLGGFNERIFLIRTEPKQQKIKGVQTTE
jgi:predicted house-cleaning noncanonical NTP pyrophosphatase (MazG superfamily)